MSTHRKHHLGQVLNASVVRLHCEPKTGQRPLLCAGTHSVGTTHSATQTGQQAASPNPTRGTDSACTRARCCVALRAQSQRAGGGVCVFRAGRGRLSAPAHLGRSYRTAPPAGVQPREARCPKIKHPRLPLARSSTRFRVCLRELRANACRWDVTRADACIHTG